MLKAISASFSPHKKLNHFIKKPHSSNYQNISTLRIDKYIKTKTKSIRKLYTSSEYQRAYDLSIKDPELFWGEAAKDIDWVKPPTKILDDSAKPFSRWFKGGVLNTCYNALDRHVVRGNGDQFAMIYDSPVTKQIKWFTFSEMLENVQKLAGLLSLKGVGKGDRVLIYMPMIPETVFAMLACARLGAIHCVVFGGFASQELTTRIEDAKPICILSAGCGLESTRIVDYKKLVDEAIQMSYHKPKEHIVFQREEIFKVNLKSTDTDWKYFINTASPFTGCVDVESTDPLYILYTSGTTGRPKGVVRDNGGHAVALNWSMKNIYGLSKNNKKEVFWAHSDLGWVVGHSYICYAPLIYGVTTILFEGKPTFPDPGVYWRVIKDHHVSVMFTSPTALRTIKKEDPLGKFVQKYDLSNFQRMFVAGERIDIPTLQWTSDILNSKPILDHYWQTESGWPIVAPCWGLGGNSLKIKLGSSNLPVPGYQVEIMEHEHDEEDDIISSTSTTTTTSRCQNKLQKLDDSSSFSANNNNNNNNNNGATITTGGTSTTNGGEMKLAKLGDIMLKLPLPPGNLLTLYENDELFLKTYITKPGYYFTGDSGYKDEDGCIHILSRTDDVIKLAAHRISTSALEEVLCSHPDVAECAVVGVNDPVKGQIPVGLVVLKSNLEHPKSEDELANELISLVRNTIGPVAVFKKVLVVKRLPKTRSGKIVRNLIRKLANGQEYRIPPTIDDCESIIELKEVIKNHLR